MTAENKPPKRTVQIQWQGLLRGIFEKEKGLL